MELRMRDLRCLTMDSYCPKGNLVKKKNQKQPTKVLKSYTNKCSPSYNDVVSLNSKYFLKTVQNAVSVKTNNN